MNFSDFTLKYYKNIAIIRINLSRATLKQAGSFNKLLFDMVKNDIKKFIIEMDEVEFIDSTFLGALVINLKKIKQLNGKLRLINLTTPVSTIIKHTGLNKIVEIFNSREEALNNI